MIDDDERAGLTGIKAFILWTAVCVAFGVLLGTVIFRGWS